MTDILSTILARKAEEIGQRSRVRTLSELRERALGQPATRGFVRAIRRRHAAGQAAVIAELKKACPSRGVIRPDFRPTDIARGYEAGGATCLSVFTDVDFFQGSNLHLSEARSACRLPVLRRDFIVDPYQVYEARLIGADAVRFIAAVLDDSRLIELTNLAEELGLDVLVAVRDIDELERALQTDCELIGIEHRSLRTSGVVPPGTALALQDAVPPDRILVAEGDIRTRSDLATLRGAGVQTFLVGESCLRETDPGAALQRLFVG